jgi:hypothetical protein
MIVKHFYYNMWELGYNWENTDYVFGVPDSDLQVEQNEKSIAVSLEISVMALTSMLWVYRETKALA